MSGREAEEGAADEGDADPERGGKRFAPAAPAVVPDPVPPPHSINLLELPTEMLLAVLEWLVKLDPIVLLGAVPGVCRRMRALCAGVRGEFDLRGEWAELDKRDEDRWGSWAGLKGALASASLHFPRTRGLWTFSRLALHDACDAGLLLAVGRLLEEDGSRVDEGDMRGWTPLLYACEYGHLEVVRLLVEKGADVEKAERYGYTALFISCEKGHLEVARLLVEKGADMDKATNGGATPFDIARHYGRTEIVAFLEQAGAAE